MNTNFINYQFISLHEWDLWRYSTTTSVSSGIDCKMLEYSWNCQIRTISDITIIIIAFNLRLPKNYPFCSKFLRTLNVITYLNFELFHTYCDSIWTQNDICELMLRVITIILQTFPADCSNMMQIHLALSGLFYYYFNIVSWAKWWLNESWYGSFTIIYRDFRGVSREPLMKSRSVTAVKAWLRVHALIY